MQAEYILRIFEEVGKVFEQKDTDNLLLQYRVEDLEKKLEAAEAEIKLLKNQ